MEAPPDVRSFEHWELGEDVAAAIADMNITVPTPIQALAIGPALAGRDIIAKAETGTGKTLAFGAPMASKLDSGRASVLGLVLCPTRELAQQVAGVLEKLGERRGLRVALVVGGEPMYPQIDALKAGAQIVVGTPGRVLDLHGQRFLSFPWTEIVVLDEADEMLEIGFLDDVRKILALTPDERQTMLFSATFPPDLLSLAREGTREPVEIATAKGLATVDSIEQRFVEVDDADRTWALVDLIEGSGPDDVFLVFCDRRTEVDQLIRRLERRPFPSKALHGGYDQASRFRVMSAFRTGEVKALIATDVASRGIDVDHVTHVVNYSVPRDISDYTHRIGRTGRAGREGKAITLVTPQARRDWNTILRQANWDIEPMERPRRGRGGDGGGRDRDRTRGGARDHDRPRPGGGDRPRRGPRDEGRASPDRRERGDAAPRAEERRSRDDSARRSRQDVGERDAPSVRDEGADAGSEPRRRRRRRARRED